MPKDGKTLNGAVTTVRKSIGEYSKVDKPAKKLSDELVENLRIGSISDIFARLQSLREIEPQDIRDPLPVLQ